MPSHHTRSSDVVVLGAGIIGAAIAWRCAQRGMSVTVVDPSPGRGAWHTAAGMLAPATELHYTEQRLLRLGIESLARWSAFATELEGETGTSVGFRTSGTVLAAWDAADMATIRDLQAFAETLGVDSELLSGRELRRLEPDLAPGIPGAFHAPGDHQVDPRLVHAALMGACRSRGVRFTEADGTVLSDGTGPTDGAGPTDGGRITGVRTADGRVVSAPRVVVAAGAWSGSVEGLPAEARVPVRPVKGQTLRLRLPGRPRLTRVVRGTVQGSPVYLVPRADGEIVVGASSDEAGFDQRPRAGAVYELLRDAQALLPELSEAVLIEVCTGLRPGSPDNAPLIGAGGLDGLFFATGHHRNGVLLTPVTADAVAQLLADGTVDDAVAPFRPGRFAAVSSSASLS